MLINMTFDGRWNTTVDKQRLARTACSCSVSVLWFANLITALPSRSGPYIGLRKAPKSLSLDVAHCTTPVMLTIYINSIKIKYKMRADFLHPENLKSSVKGLLDDLILAKISTQVDEAVIKMTEEPVFMQNYVTIS
jgi:hypothetical protein